jgi:hypothetical protein
VYLRAKRLSEEERREARRGGASQRSRCRSTCACASELWGPRAKGFTGGGSPPDHINLAGTSATSPAAGGVRGVSPRQPSSLPASAADEHRQQRRHLVIFALAASLCSASTAQEKEVVGALALAMCERASPASRSARAREGGCSSAREGGCWRARPRIVRASPLSRSARAREGGRLFERQPKPCARRPSEASARLGGCTRARRQREASARERGCSRERSEGASARAEDEDVSRAPLHPTNPLGECRGAARSSSSNTRRTTA